MDHLSHLFRDLGRERRGVLMLDYDGTLAPFRVERDRATPYKGVRSVLNAIQQVGGTRLVIVGGGPVGEVLPLLALPTDPEIWGCHGWQRRHPDGRIDEARPAAMASGALDLAWVSLEDDGLQVRAERKTASVAVHWRGESERRAREIRESVLARWRPLGEREGLELLEFSGGLELRAEGRDKGVAVRAILAESWSPSAAAYLGDDATDEDAFRAIEGRGVGVLVAENSRPTAASAILRPPGELLAFLDRWLRVSRDPGAGLPLEEGTTGA